MSEVTGPFGMLPLYQGVALVENVYCTTGKHWFLWFYLNSPEPIERHGPYVELCPACQLVRGLR